MFKALFKCTVLLTFGIAFFGFVVACTETIEPKDATLNQQPQQPPGTVLTDFLPFASNTFTNSVDTVAAYSFVDANNPNLDVRVINHSSSTVIMMPARFYTGIVKATVNPQSGILDSAIIEDHHLDTFLYKKNARIYKVDVSNVYDPKSVQLSAEGQANSICHEWDRWADDFQNSENSRYIYYVSDDCVSGEWRMVRLGNSVTDLPDILPANIDYTVSHINNQQTGELVAWLVVEKINSVSTLVRYDQDFQIQSRQVIIPVVEEGVKIELLAFTSDEKVLLANHNQILFYDDSVANRAIVDTVSVFDVNEQKTIANHRVTGDYFYFTVKDKDLISTSLNRVLLDGANGSADELVSVNGDIEKIEVSDQYLLYSNNGVVTRITLSDLSSTLFPMRDGYVLGLDKSEYVFYVINDYVFIELMSISDNTQRLVWVINETELSQQDFLEGHYLVGAIFESDLSYSTDKKVEALIFETGGLVSGSRSVHVLTPGNYPSMKMLGTLPDATGQHLLKRYFASGHRKGLLEANVKALREIFYFDADVENSLKRITNNNVNETVINH